MRFTHSYLVKKNFTRVCRGKESARMYNAASAFYKTREKKLMILSGVLVVLTSKSCKFQCHQTECLADTKFAFTKIAVSTFSFDLKEFKFQRK